MFNNETIKLQKILSQNENPKFTIQLQFCINSIRTIRYIRHKITGTKTIFLRQQADELRTIQKLILCFRTNKQGIHV